MWWRLPQDLPPGILVQVACLGMRCRRTSFKYIGAETIEQHYSIIVSVKYGATCPKPLLTGFCFNGAGVPSVLVYVLMLVIIS